MKTNIRKTVKQGLLGAMVLCLALGASAFGSLFNPPAGEYVLIGDTWRPVTEFPAGECLDEPGICSYQKIGSAPGPENDEFRNPANFQAVDQGMFETNE